MEFFRQRLSFSNVNYTFRFLITWHYILSLLLMFISIIIIITIAAAAVVIHCCNILFSKIMSSLSVLVLDIHICVIVLFQYIFQLHSSLPFLSNEYD